MLDATWPEKVQVKKTPVIKLLLPWDGVLEGTVRNKVAFILLVEELTWEVVLQVNNASIVKAVVEVLCLFTAFALQKEVFWELVLKVCSLVEGVLTIQQHVP